jgi:hypothetical protein
MRRLSVLTCMAMLALAADAHASTLNKCIDARGQVTYSNLPCHNAREVRTLEVDPPPPAATANSQSAQSAPARRTPAQTTLNPVEKATITLETQRTSGKPVKNASARQCDAIGEQLGKVLDKMDQARRAGYTQKQMDAWNREVKTLESRKQRGGCF